MTYAIFKEDNTLDYTCEYTGTDIPSNFIDVTNVTEKFNAIDKEGNLIFIEAKFDLEKEKNLKIKKLHLKYQNAYDAYLAQYPKREIESFPLKQNEALAYQKDNTTPTPVIDAIVGGNAELKKEYIDSVIKRVSFVAQQEGQMLAKRDAIKICKTKEELEAIDV